jgi:hypothetical protein
MGKGLGFREGPPTKLLCAIGVGRAILSDDDSIARVNSVPNPLLPLLPAVQIRLVPFFELLRLTEANKENLNRR